MDWLDLLAGQGTLQSLLQHHSSKASILQLSAFFMVQLSHLYMTTGESWIIKKVEPGTADAFELWYWRRLLGILWTAKRSNQSILKEINPEY